MRLSIKAMHYFLTAVDLRSIVQAAQQRNVVSSAISTAIDAVEREFGLKLIQRFPAKGIQSTATDSPVRNLVGAGVGGSILNMRPFGSATHNGKPVVEIPIQPPVQSLRLVLGYLDGNPRQVVSAVRESILAYFGTPEARKLIVANKGRTRRRAVSSQATDEPAGNGQ